MSLAFAALTTVASITDSIVNNSNNNNNNNYNNNYNSNNNNNNNVSHNEEFKPRRASHFRTEKIREKSLLWQKNRAQQQIEDVLGKTVSFNVVKTHHLLGLKKDQRILRLTCDGVENVKPPNKITRSFPYSTIVRVILKDSENLILQYHGAHDFYYFTPVALQIVQEISDRMAAFRMLQENKLERKSASISVDYEKNIQLDHISDLLKQSIAPKGSKEAAEMSNSPSSPSSPNSPQIINSPTTLTLPHNPSTARRVLSARKLAKLLGNTELQRISLATDRICFAPNSVEHLSITTFLHNFSSEVTIDSMKKIRRFMDGVREYINENRIDELDMLLIELQKTSESAAEKSLMTCIEGSLEKAVLLPLNQRIWRYLNRIEEIRTKDLIYSEKIRKLRDKSQQFFEIADECICPSNWKLPIKELAKLSTAETPQEKLQALLTSAKCIYISHNYYKNMYNNSTKYYLSADDFIPIHIFVLTRSDIQWPFATCEYLFHLCAPEQVIGEGGYYLTVFSSAIEFIVNMDTETGQATL